MIWPLLTRSWNNLLVDKLLFTHGGLQIDFVVVHRAWLHHAADKCLPQRAHIAKRPWISSDTLSLLQSVIFFF